MKQTAILTAVLVLAGAMSATVANAQEAPEPDNSHTLRIATGARGKGYSKLFANVQAVCGQQVALSEVNTEGGLQNLTALAANQADLGFVQLDTLQDLKSSDDNIGALLAVMPVNQNLLHVLAPTRGFDSRGPERLGGFIPGKMQHADVAKFSDLKGLPVAVVGSARALGRVLDRRYALGIQFVDVDTDEQALTKIKNGEVAGMFSTSGWPNGPLMKLKRDAGVRLLPFDLAVQPPYQLVRKNYENLDTFNHAFLASANLLVTRPFSLTGTNGKAVAQLQACLQKNLSQLQDGAYEPSWREVRNTSDTLGWPRFVAATSGKRAAH